MRAARDEANHVDEPQEAGEPDVVLPVYGADLDVGGAFEAVGDEGRADLRVSRGEDAVGDWNGVGPLGEPAGPLRAVEVADRPIVEAVQVCAIDHVRSFLKHVRPILDRVTSFVGYVRPCVDHARVPLLMTTCVPSSGVPSPAAQTRSPRRGSEAAKQAALLSPSSVLPS